MATTSNSYPENKPTKVGNYLVKGRGGVDDRTHYWVCLYITKRAADEAGIPEGFYFGGNTLYLTDGCCEWVAVEDIL